MQTWALRSCRARSRRVFARTRCFSEPALENAFSMISYPDFRVRRQNTKNPVRQNRQRGHATFLEYGSPNTAFSASVGSSVRTTTSMESDSRIIREKSRYRP